MESPRSVSESTAQLARILPLLLQETLVLLIVPLSVRATNTAQPSSTTVPVTLLVCSSSNSALTADSHFLSLWLEGGGYL
ncbi:hypothetical protein DL96DRAFT_1635093 [Flagelloscypha sp. PMI_526]|nr:hypothetical protein DL96DRAFT_1635093 [Flagelloscypha sp. PMI_526]